MKLKQLKCPQGRSIPEYIKDKSCARCVHKHDTGKEVGWFCADLYCDIDNHKINFMESFSIACEYQERKIV